MRHMRAGSAAGALPPGLVTQSFSEAEGRDFRSQTTNGSSNISGGGGVSSSGGATSGVTSASGASLPPARAAAADATAPVHGSGGSGAASASGAAGVGSSAPPPSATPPPATPVATNVFSIKPVYVLLFGVIMAGGLLFASMSLQLTSGIPFTDALTRVLRRILRSIAFRQLVVIAVAILLVRFSLNSVLRLLAAWSSSPVAWDKSRMYYVMKEVYSPLELLLFIAGCCTLADSFVPQLINVPKATVTHVVRVVLSTSFVVGAATVMYNLKSRFCKEQAWQYEMQGDVTSQRRWEAYDKLCTFAIYAVSVVVGIQALGLEVRSVLAIGGIGGLAIGLAGREICENILNGFLIMTTVPFEVGDEILFRPNGQVVEGIVVDVGWYRTTIRSFEREMYVIPNAVFSKNTVLNVSRKAKEWRFNETLAVRVQDVHKVNAIIQDIRRIVRNDGRIINKLHRRVFLDKITCEDVKVYVSFYVEGTNRDAFMAVKQDLLLAFVDCIERNGAKLATPRTVVEMEEATATMLSGLGFGVGMGGLPIVKVVEQVDVTPIAQIPAVTGQAPSASVPAPANGRDPSSNINGSSSGGGGGAKAANSAGKPASGDPVFQQPQQQGTGQQQQQQRQQQPASPSGGLQQQQPPQQPPQQPSQQQPQQQPPQQQQQPVPVGTLAFAAGAVSTAAASTSVPPRRGGDTAAPASRGGAAVAAAAGAAAAAGPEPSPPASASTRTPMASPLPGNPGGSYVVLSDYAAGWGVAGAAAVGASAAAAALTTDQAVIMASFEELY